MRQITFFLVILLVISCSEEKRSREADRAYVLLEEVWEKNARGDKQAALALADSALSMYVTDTTRCWLMCEKAVALFDMGKMDEAISAGRVAKEFAERIGDAQKPS